MDNFLFELLKARGKAERKALLDIGDKELYQYRKTTKANFIVAVAHFDTVGDGDFIEKQIIETSGIVTCKNGILGADDIAGIYAVLKLQERFPDKVNVLLCDYEERGAVGSRCAVVELEKELKKALCFISFDRCGVNDVVYYLEPEKDFARIFDEAGFMEEVGTFSDVKILSEEFNIASANISTGYFNEHSRSEYLYLPVLEHNIERVGKLVKKLTSRKFKLEKKEKVVTYKPNYWEKYFTGRRYMDTYEALTCYSGYDYCEYCYSKEAVNWVCEDCFEKIAKYDELGIEECDNVIPY